MVNFLNGVSTTSLKIGTASITGYVATFDAAGNVTPQALLSSAVIGTTEDTQGFTYVTQRQNLRGTNTPLSQQLNLYGFTAGSSRTISKLGLSVGATAAAGLTFCKLGLYSVTTATGALTLVASTPNTTTAAAVAFNPYQIGLSVSYALVAGTRYMTALLITATTMPILNAAAGSDDYGKNNYANGQQQRLVGTLATQTDLPATIADSALGANGNAPNILLII